MIGGRLAESLEVLKLCGHAVTRTRTRGAGAAEDLALAEGIYGVRLTGQRVGLLAEWARAPKAHDGKVSLGLCAPGETGLPPTVAFARVVDGFEEDLRHIAQEDPTSEDLLPALEAERDGNLTLLRHLKAGDAARFSPAPWEKGCRRKRMNGGSEYAMTCGAATCGWPACAWRICAHAERRRRGRMFGAPALPRACGRTRVACLTRWRRGWAPGRAPC